MNIAGVDVGLSGAIAIINDKGGIIDRLDMPVIATDKKRELDETDIKEAFADWNVCHAYIEKAQSMPGQGIASTGHYLTSYGIIRGICAGLSIPYTLVSPVTWKKAMMPDMAKDKGASIIRVKQLYPDIKMNRKKDHGQADAILIALYGLRYRG